MPETHSPAADQSAPRKRRPRLAVMLLLVLRRRGFRSIGQKLSSLLIIAISQDMWMINLTMNCEIDHSLIRYTRGSYPWGKTTVQHAPFHFIGD